MQLQNSKKKNERGDEEEVEKEARPKCSPFYSALSEAKDVESTILLLQSEEEATLLAAVEALSKYASKSKDNVRILFDLGVVNNVLPIIKHKDLFIRRFAAKLLVEMTAIPDLTIFFIESNYLLYFVKLLISEKDIFMQEYFSAILARLSRNPYVAALLANHCLNMNFLFDEMQSSDPDIKKNNLEILYNLMQDLVAAYKISKTEKFNFSLLYQHYESSYPEIQCLALNVVASIIERSKDEDIQFLFYETNGVEALLNFLKNSEWNNLHIKALKILYFAAENPVIVDKLIEIESIPEILNYIEHVTTQNLFIEAFKVIVQIANTLNGRKVLFSYEIVEHLIDALQRWTQSDIIEIVCYGIGKMALFSPATKEFASKESVKIILDLLKKENLQWSAKHAAIFALKQLLISDIRNCDIFLEIHGQDYLLQLIKQFVKQVPVETCIISLEALLAITYRPKLRDILINLDIFDTICLLLESVYPFLDELKISCCNLLSMLCLENSGRHYFIKANGPQRMYPLITDTHSISVRNSAIQFIQTISTDLTVANAFVENKYLSYMLSNSSSRIIPSWDTCIETLFKSHLPIKFALTGRLSLQDLTQNGFYVLRRNICPFPILDDIFRFKYCPLEPIYVVNCIQSSTLPNALEAVFEENINTLLESKFGRLQCDPYFTEYVELFKRMILAKESKRDVDASDIDQKLTNIRYVLLRAKMLARFVARQMSGFDSTSRCIDHQLEVHLREIKECLETSVIPIGQLRVGSYLERALLFKAIADRICLPAALVRGKYGISWIEIAIPQIEDSNERKSFRAYLDEKDACREEVVTSVSFRLLDKSNASAYHNEHKIEKISSQQNYPSKLIKPNFIVDLMDTPGDLIPIGSLRSKLYCTKKITYNKIC
ncbi:armadillo repeat-containing protein 3 [Nylanderia fulva]|uniref:armadillo repeat-containing protein 3 n=1 Tax=Nylanderia fulva TaxID=613905 RepID=UPI0010FB47C6|nr:armadillo repeat-containing protein 3 [Nylanderia fulva]